MPRTLASMELQSCLTLTVRNRKSPAFLQITEKYKLSEQDHRSREQTFSELEELVRRKVDPNIRPHWFGSSRNGLVLNTSGLSSAIWFKVRHYRSLKILEAIQTLYYAIYNKSSLISASIWSNWKSTNFWSCIFTSSYSWFSDMDITLDVSKLNHVDPTHILSELAMHVSCSFDLELPQSQISMFLAIELIRRKSFHASSSSSEKNRLKMSYLIDNLNNTYCRANIETWNNSPTPDKTEQVVYSRRGYPTSSGSHRQVQENGQRSVWWHSRGKPACYRQYSTDQGIHGDWRACT